MARRKRPTPVPTGPPERVFPGKPLVVGPMPPEGDPAWGGLPDLCCEPGQWAYVVTVGGRNVLQIRHPATGDGHRNAGTTRDELYGATVCAAFGLYAASAADFPALTGSDWAVVWQNQQIGSPMASIEIPSSGTKTHWNVSVRQNATQVAKVPVVPITYGRWEFFVVCYRLSAAGFVRMWHASGVAPDVTKPPTFERLNFDTWQHASTSDKAHETLGIYSKTTVPRRLSFWGYGRSAGDPARAIALAGLPKGGG